MSFDITNDAGCLSGRRWARMNMTGGALCGATPRYEVVNFVCNSGLSAPALTGTVTENPAW